VADGQLRGEEATVAGQRYEFRVQGRLSERARDAFAGMQVVEVPAETVISGPVDDAGLHAALALIQSLGLHVVSVQRVAAGPRLRP
jgi:hypothetical protein